MHSLTELQLKGDSCTQAPLLQTSHILLDGPFSTSVAMPPQLPLVALKQTTGAFPVSEAETDIHTDDSDRFLELFVGFCLAFESKVSDLSHAWV